MGRHHAGSASTGSTATIGAFTVDIPISAGRRRCTGQKTKTVLTGPADAFNAVLYTKPLPPALGFIARQCIGEVCIAQRAGGCRTFPMTPIPLPEPLVKLAGG
jgi:hypothetical protein